MNDIHPTSTGGNGRIVPRRTTYKPGDTVVDILHCYQCGMPFRMGKDTEGPSQESPGVSHTTYLSSTNLLVNPTFDGIFPQVGSRLTVVVDKAAVCPGWIMDQGTSAVPITVRRASVSPNDDFLNVRYFSTSAAAKIFVKQLVPGWQSLVGSIIRVACELYSGENNVDGFYIDDGVSVQNSPLADNDSGATSQVVTADFSVSPNATQVVIGIGHIVSSSFGFYVRNPTLYPFLTDTANSGGCRFCGSMNPRGIGVHDGAFESGVDLSKR